MISFFLDSHFKNHLNSILWIVILKTSHYWNHIFLAKLIFLRILVTGCARRGVSGALYPKSAYAGLNSRPRTLCLATSKHLDWTPRNRRSRTSSDPEGSSDKWCGLCRGSISICIMGRGIQKRFDGGCATTLHEIADLGSGISDLNKVQDLI